MYRIHVVPYTLTSQFANPISADANDVLVAEVSNIVDIFLKTNWSMVVPATPFHNMPFKSLMDMER